MKYFILISCVLLINTAVSLKTEDEDSYFTYEDDDTDVNEKPPIYDLKEAPKLFEKFIKDYNKKYEDDKDYNKHYKNFVSSLKYINEVNSEGRSSSSDINMFADYEETELEVLTGGFEGDE